LQSCGKKNVDGRDKPGHDGKRLILKPPNPPYALIAPQKLPDGQITQNLSSPSVKNISLCPWGKSVV
jgi:hypothetical protein